MLVTPLQKVFSRVIQPSLVFREEALNTNEDYITRKTSSTWGEADQVEHYRHRTFNTNLENR